MDFPIPKIKKRVYAFLVGEEGKISKKTLLNAGIVLGSMALSSAIAQACASHNNALHTNNVDTPGAHGHSLAHCSHGSHSSHGHHSNCHPGCC